MKLKTFKQLINENIIFDKKFIKNVEDFIFKNEKRYITKIVKNKSKIPDMFKTPMTLYRGMILDKETIKTIENDESLILNDYSSWTSNEKIAERFINDSSKSVKKSGSGIIFKKKMNKEIILNIQSLIMFLDSMGRLEEFDFDELNKEMAFEEAEVICDKGINLTKKNIYKYIK